MDKAGVTRSLNAIRSELEYLRDAGVIAPQQFQSIMAQLPQANGMPSQYVQQQQYNNIPQQIAQQSQDPNHPANPQNPKHHQWAQNLGGKLGNALVWGAGATFGGDIANTVFHDL